MWEGGLGAAFSFVPLVQSVRAATKSVTVASSHFTRSLDDMMLRPAVNSNVPMQPTANLNRISVPHSLFGASEVNGIQGLAQHLSGGSGAAGIKQTTMSSAIPTKDSIIMYCHVKDSTGQLIEAAIGIKGKTSGVLSLTQPTKGLIEGANEASAAYKRVRAGMASPTSVASGGVSNKSLTILGKEQPWTIHHEGQLWKTKIVGEAQWTGTRAEQTMRTNAHAEQCYRAAVELAQDLNVEKVFLNRGIKKASGQPIQGSNRRPDVTYVTKDGKVHQLGVQSRTDDYDMLLDRMKITKNNLPVEIQGDIKVIHYRDYMRAIDK